MPAQSDRDRKGTRAYGSSFVCSTLLAAIVAALILCAAAVAKPTNVDFGPYMAKLQSTIKAAWNPPKSDVSKHAIIAFKVNADGSIAQAKVQSTSGSETFDRAALSTLDQVHLDPLPQGSGENVDVQFTFDHNVHNGHRNGNHTAGSESGPLHFLPGDEAAQEAGALALLIVLGLQLFLAVCVVVWLVLEKLKMDKRRAANLPHK